MQVAGAALSLPVVTGLLAWVAQRLPRSAATLPATGPHAPAAAAALGVPVAAGLRRWH
jgi:hypothetical protein